MEAKMARTKSAGEAALALAEVEIGDLPGAAKVDKKLLDEVVEHVNHLHTAKGLELARAMGEYLVKTLFGGKLENFGAEKKHASWRALAERDDILVSHSTLWYSVAILAQLRQLPEDIGTALSVSHHRRLLPVRDAKAKETLAKRVVEEGLTIAQLEKEVARQRKKEKKGDRRGRPAIPDYLKSLRRLPKLVDPLRDYVISTEDVEAAGVDAMREILKSLSEQLDTLQAAKEEIEAALEAAREE